MFVEFHEYDIDLTAFLWKIPYEKGKDPNVW